ncbi:MAG: hypothetical protein ACSHWU_02050 [Marinicella sp.]
MKKSNRRTFLKTSVMGGAIVVAHPSGALQPTPEDVKGPFYPLTAQQDQDFDLTQVEGKSEAALGDVVFIHGRVLDTEGNPIKGATVDIWQANAAGRYNHPHDENQAPLDPNFQGWAIVQSGTEGEFKFKTVVPGAYPAEVDWLRPPHIHFKVSKLGYVEIITQMYFPQHELNDIDRLLQSKTPAEQAMMIAKRNPNHKATLDYQLVLQKL